jgi:acyl-coenzyme A synthetase/AMP-(fatty) acid ligase
MLREWLPEAAEPASRYLASRDAIISLSELRQCSGLGNSLGALHGRSVLVATGDQLTTAMALIELDGFARRLVLLPPDAPAEQLPAVIAEAEVDAVVTVANDARDFGDPLRINYDANLLPARISERARHRTEWVLFTSGTTGSPKMVAHSLPGLTAAIKPRHGQESVIWATFYDIRRYGGLQIFLRAILDGGSLVLSDAKEAVADHLARLGKHGVTHVSGTPSHWRRVLMSPATAAMAPRYIRLSGEIADQAVLDGLRECYPTARVGHAFASTEAGVGFEVNDGLEGFPASLIEQPGDVQMKVVDGSLRIRSNRTAVDYVGGETSALAEDDGFVDTGDILERRGNRYYFIGRKNGIINVGGLKVHPEEVEAVINRHPEVQASLVRARKNPIMGSIVVADIVLKDTSAGERTDGRTDTLKRAILDHCRSTLPQHKVPVIISFVPALSVGEAGKLARHHA